MKNRFIQFSFLLGFLLIQSCRNQEVVYSAKQKTSPKPDPTILTFIDSYGDENRLSGKRYFLLPYDSIDLGNYLQYELFESYVKKELSQRNYQRVSQFDSADCVIFFKYGSSDKQVFQRDIYLPIYGQTGNSVSFVDYGGQLRYYPWSGIYNTQSVTTTTAQYGIASEVPYKTTEYYFSHYLILSAFERSTMRQDFKRSLKWKLITRLDSKDHDLRRLFPYLVISAGPYVGKDSRQEVSSSISIKDRKYNWLVNNLPDEYLNQKTINMENGVLNEEEMKIAEISRYKSFYSFKKFNDADEVKIGNLVMIKSGFGDMIYGLISDVKSSSKIVLITYPFKGNRQLINCSFSELYKLKEF